MASTRLRLNEQLSGRQQTPEQHESLAGGESSL